MDDKPLPVVTEKDRGDTEYAARLLEFEMDPQNFLQSMRARRQSVAQRLDARQSRRVII